MYKTCIQFLWIKKTNIYYSNLTNNIDLSLQMNEPDYFYQLTQILNVLKSKDIQSTLNEGSPY